MRIRPRISRSAFLVAFLVLCPAMSTAQKKQDATDHVDTDVDEVVEIEVATSPYKLKLSLSYDESSGNTNTTAGSAKFELEKFWDKWGVTTKAHASRKEEVVTIKENYQFDLFVNRNLRDDLALALVGQWQRDVFKGLDQQLVLGLGLRWSAIEREGWVLTLLGGPAWSREEFTASSQVREFNVGLLELNNSYAFSSTTDLSTIVTYYASLEDSEDYRLDGEVVLETAINSYLSMGLEYILEYDNRPAARRVSTDKTFAAYLTFKWSGKKPKADGSKSSKGSKSSGG